MKNRGFSLVELMITTALFSAMTVIVMQILITSQRGWSAGSDIQELQNNLNLGMSNMLRELQNTNLDKITADADSVVFQVPVGYNTGGEIIWGADNTSGNKISYSVDVQRRLVRGLLNAADSVVSSRILANDIQTLAFDFTANIKIITISLTAIKQSFNHPDVFQNISSKVSFRN